MEKFVIEPFPLQGWAQLGQVWLDQGLQAQRLQCALWSAWLASFETARSELWDEWACRWAGGAPIDA